MRRQFGTSGQAVEGRYYMEVRQIASSKTVLLIYTGLN